MTKFRPNNSREKSRVNKTKPEVYIFTEGQVTEPEYLNDWLNNAINNNPELKNIKRKIQVGSAPQSVYDDAAIVRNDDKKARIYIVIDEDDRILNSGKNLQNINNVFKKCNTLGDNKDTGINCIFSNRSVEFWALLHFQDTSSPFNKTSLEKALKEHLPDYDPKDNKKFNFDILTSNNNEEDAIKRAKNIRKNHKKMVVDPYKERPTTNFDELIVFLKEKLSL